MEDFKRRVVVTRQVHVYWQVEKDVDKAIGRCVADWINDLLRGDTSLPARSDHGAHDISDEEVDRLAVRKLGTTRGYGAHDQHSIVYEIFYFLSRSKPRG